MNLVKKHSYSFLQEAFELCYTACWEKNAELNDNRLEEQQNNMTNILLEQRNWKSFKLNFHI